MPRPYKTMLTKSSKPARRSPISPRVLTALIGLPIVIAIVHIGGWLLAVVAVVLATLAIKELTVATETSSTRIESFASSLMLFPFLAICYYGHVFTNAKWNVVPSTDVIVALIVILPLFFAVIAFNSQRKMTLLSLSLTVFAALYLSLFAFIPLLQAQPNGHALLWLTLLGVWTGDTVAYYAGRRFGKTKLTPLSPGKSSEGLLAGFVATVSMSVLIAHIAHLGIVNGIVFGACVGVFAPLGDLAESFWKRELGVKDLGTILPGHGGVLDRCDSLLFAAPMVYLAAKMLNV